MPKAGTPASFAVTFSSPEAAQKLTLLIYQDAVARFQSRAQALLAWVPLAVREEAARCWHHHVVATGRTLAGGERVAWLEVLNWSALYPAALRDNTVPWLYKDGLARRAAEANINLDAVLLTGRLQEVEDELAR
jgi:hypothetical protein